MEGKSNVRVELIMIIIRKGHMSAHEHGSDNGLREGERERKRERE